MFWKKCTMLRCSTYITVRSEILFWRWGCLEMSVGVRKTVKTISSICRRIKIQESAHCHHCLTVEQQLHRTWGPVHNHAHWPGQVLCSCSDQVVGATCKLALVPFYDSQTPGKRQQLSSCDICYLRHKTFLVGLHCPHAVVTPVLMTVMSQQHPSGEF